MNLIPIINKTFEKTDFTKDNLTYSEYECCIFKNCIFSNSDLSNVAFNECEFFQCDLTMVKIINSVFNDIVFDCCKLLGSHFNDCNPLAFSVNFKDCNLNLTSFYRLKLRKTIFKNCLLQDSDFTETDLTGSHFDNCNLLNTVFFNSNLEKTDFYSSFNYSIDPEKNRMKKARFSNVNLAGLLDKYNLIID